MIVELVKEFVIEAAHRNIRATDKAARLHGHSFRIEVVVDGEIDPRLGWLIDYGDIRNAFKPFHDQLDHRYLNEIEGLETGALEDLAAWLEDRLKPSLPCLKRVRVSVVGDNAFRPVDLEADPERGLPRRLRFTFEAAQSLPNLPPGHPCRRLHGHSYRVEAGADDLDALRGPLEALYDELDHRCLNDTPDLNEATSERLCAWIWDRLSAKIDGLRVVAVQETATARCVYRGQ